MDEWKTLADIDIGKIMSEGDGNLIPDKFFEALQEQAKFLMNMREFLRSLDPDFLDSQFVHKGRGRWVDSTRM